MTIENDVLVLDNRLIDKSGTVVYYPTAIMELFYKGIKPEEIAFYPKDDKDVEAFNRYAYENYDGIQIKFPDRIKTSEERKQKWFYPSEIDTVNLKEYFMFLFSKENIDPVYKEIYEERINVELQKYKEKGFEKFLRFCIYFSYIIKDKNLVIGVGRGSSCASYLLYLLKIHLVDSVKYSLDICEFLK